MDLFDRLMENWMARRNANEATYVYTPFRSAKKQIRLIQLLSSTDWTSPIEVELGTFQFKERDYPYYEALSYTWGSAADLVSIFVVNRKHQSSKVLAVTENCAEALRYLRREREARILWVDAICINQASDTAALAERGMQVAMMGKIYSRAARVNAWVGPATKDSHFAMAWIETVAKHLSIDHDNGQLKSISDDPIWCTAPETFDSYANIDEYQVDALANLLSRPYFTRLWIWPEVRRGTRRAQLVCGYAELPWLSFCASSEYLMGKSLRYYRGNDQFNKSFGALQRLIHPVLLSLLTALDEMRSCECLNAKDRVYVAQTMQLKEGLQILPDYSSSVSVSDVWTDAILNYIRVDRNLWFLSDVHEISTKFPGLPSWVPDWSQPRLTCKYSYGQASAYSAVSVTGVDRHALKLHGVPVGTIRKITPFQYTANDKRPNDQEADSALEAILVGHVSMETMWSQLLSLCTVLCLGRFRHDYEPPLNGQGTAEQAQAYLLWLLHGESSDKSSEDHDTARFIMRDHCLGRALLSSMEGHLGLGPKNTKPGDILAVLLGCNELIVLRPVDHECYQVVGDAYYEGFMNGEALLGSLPDDIEAISVMIQKYGHLNSAFRDVNTGTITYEDPRLPPLPLEWRKDIDKNELPFFRHGTTREWRGYRQDPRLDVEELKTRGVELEEFTLV